MPAMTVTATQSVATANGMLLAVKVLTGAAAAASQTGATLTTTSGNPSFTTTVTGSVVYGAFSSANEDTFTATAASTIIAQHQDTPNGAGYSAWRATAATGTPGATTLGVTGGTFGTNGSAYAAAEVLAAGTIAEDGSAPAVATTDTATAITTASFTPVGSALLVAIVSCDGTGSTLVVTITDTAGLTWRKLAFEAPVSFMGAGVWVADTSAALNSGPNSCTSGTDLGGGTGSWSNPGNITADDGSAATWAVV